jgi:hypothetical protein
MDDDEEGRNPLTPNQNTTTLGQSLIALVRSWKKWQGCTWSGVTELAE